MKQTAKESLRQNKLAAHKRLGQNFLINETVSQAIVRSGHIIPSDCIVEVGVGLGALTNMIAEQAREVIGIEIDSGLIRYHSEQNSLAENVTLLHQDVLKTDLQALTEQCGQKLKIIANLPYSISNPFIFKLIENRQYVDTVVVMLQKEMAERLVAEPSTKEYGIPSVLLQAYADVERLFIVKPHDFHPQPKVDSMVIRIDFSQYHSKLQQFHEIGHQLFQQVVRTSFSQRRKTLSNNLTALPKLQGLNLLRSAMKQLLLQILQRAEIPPNERAENLTVSDFARLTEAFCKELPGSDSRA